MIPSLRIFNYSVQISLVQSLSHVQLCNPMNCSTPGLPVHHQLRSLPKPTSFKLVMPSSHLILCRPLLLLPPIPPSIRVFSSESTLRMRWPKFWSFSFSTSPPMSTQDWSLLGWTSCIPLLSKGLLLLAYSKKNLWLKFINIGDHKTLINSYQNILSRKGKYKGVYSLKKICWVGVSIKPLVEGK